MFKLNSMPAWQLTLLVVLISAAFVAPSHVFAQDFLSEACSKAYEVWDYGKRSIYVLAGIGILVMAVFAFFGRFKWSHLFALGGGVLLVATAAELIEWLGGAGTECA